ncbi:MAG: DUF4135 domain-containing protein [Rothia sp. (in: high G+C Gram-positive bacteria)]|nr:DUF4135 domain-containing protein [Rothia sp. (in: high G+C Gram-positive bacteria)]
MEGGQLLQRWVMSGRPGDREAVALRASIVAADLYRALAEAQLWWQNDAIQLGVQSADLCEVLPGLGDFHGGHRSVMAMRTKCGQMWILRPSSGELESFIGNILRCCELSNIRITVPVFSQNDHSWYRYLSAPASPTTATALTMREAGALLACGWALRAIDFHRGNVLIASGNLTLVDSETFLQPKPSRWNSVNERQWAESVLGVGVLPRRVSSGGPESIEVGLVLNTPPSDGRTPFPRAIITADEKGEIMASWDHSAPAIKDGLHLPSGESLITPLAEKFVEGANECRTAILRHEDAVLSLLRTPDKYYTPKTSRVILTPTYRYAQILRLLAHPLVISDEQASITAAATISQKGDPQLWPAEAMQMLSGDVPAFACNYGSTKLTTLRGEEIPEELGGGLFYVELSPKQAAITRIQNELPRQDLWDEQIRWMHAAFRARDAQLPVSCDPLPQEESDECRVINRIVNSIGDNPERIFGADSLSVLVGEDFDRAWEPGACGDELYGGMAGIINALLLLNVPSTAQLLERCRAMGLRWARDTWKGEPSSKLGLWDGAGGVLLTLVRLHQGHPVPVELCTAIKRYSDAVLSILGNRMRVELKQGLSHMYIDDAIQEAEVIGGSAGRIRFWIELSWHDDEQLAKIALRTAEQELNFLRAVLYRIGAARDLEPDRRGYAHGLAGILDTYLGASRMLGRDLTEDNDIISSHMQSIKNWLRNPENVPLGWCHGLAGYALALWEGTHHMDFLKDAFSALDPVIDSLSHVDVGIGPSSCHGAAGIVETLDVVSAHYPVLETHAQYCESVLRRALSEESTFKESGATALMCGLAGVVTTIGAVRRPCGIVTAPWHERLGPDGR